MKYHSILSLSAVLFLTDASAYIASQARGTNPSDNADGNRSASSVYPTGITNPGDGSQQGEPATFSWSIVPDGTSYYTGSTTSGTMRISDAISAWDAAFSVPVVDQTPDLTNRDWFRGLSDGLELIAKRSGVNYIYEPNDDGLACTLTVSASSGETDPGVAGVRGDLRFAGSADLFAGGLSTTTVSELHHPEVYMHTGNLSTESALRFVMCHEAMHALSFSHSTVNGTANQSAVTGSGGTSNGPQFDDICGLHRKYGDFYEKNGGNDTLATATNIGSVSYGDTIIIGDDADDTTVALDEFDFISIDDISDTDFLKFTINQTQEVTITLDPRGPTYTNYGTDWNATSQAANTVTIVADQINDLVLTVYDASGNLIQSVDSGSWGDSETLTLTLAAGDYYAKVTGTTDPAETPHDPSTTINNQFYGTQLYALSVESSVAIPVAQDLSLNTPLSTALPVTLVATDANGDPLTYTVTVPPVNGTLSGTAPNLTYTPDSGYCGLETFTYIANDGTVDSDPATVTIIVNAPAVILAGYDFDDGTGTATNTVTLTDSNISGSDFSVGAGLISPPYINSGATALAENLDADGNVFGTANPLSYGGNRNARIGFTRLGDLAGAINTGDYLSFTLSPINGAQMNLSSFTFRTHILDVTEGVNSWSLYSSLDSFSTAITSGTTATTNTWVGNTVDLLTPDYQELSAPVEFRLYIYNGRNNANSQTLFDKFVVNGNTHEPLTGYDAFIANSTGISDNSFSADVDGDGVPNGIEYMLGADPQVHDCKLPTFVRSGTDIILSFSRNIDSPQDTTQILEYGNDLVNWTDINLTGAISSEVSIGTATGGLEPITITIDNSVTQHKEFFWRFKVSQ